MRFAKLTQRIAGDGAAAWDIHYRALAMQAEGKDVLLLSVGDPDFDTPAPIVEAAIDSLRDGHTHYSDVRGKLALRQAIARRHQQRSGQAVSADRSRCWPVRSARCSAWPSACSIRATR